MEKLKGAIWNLVSVALVAVAVYGWILNIIVVIKTVHDPATGIYVVRLFGIPFFPLGVVLGLFD